MLNCREIQLYLDDYLADRLKSDFRSQIEEHLKSCEICREELEQTSILLDIVKADKVPNPGDKYWDNLETTILSNTFDREDIPVREEPRRPVITFIKYAISLAAAVIVFAVSIVLSGAEKESTLSQVSSDNRIIASIEIGESQSALISSILISTPGSVGQQGIILGHIASTGKDNNDARFN